MGNTFRLFVAVMGAWFSCLALAGGESSRKTTDLGGPGWTCDGEAVLVPHTWNALDACDGPGSAAVDWSGYKGGDSVGGKGYVKKRAVYRRMLPAKVSGRRYFLKFEGASVVADVSVNGRAVGRHVGAFTAFAFEVTDFLRADGPSELIVGVDNRWREDTQPMSADYSVYGGLYRTVWLIETDLVCIDPVTDGADGVVVFADPVTGDVTAHVAVLGGTNEVQRFHVADHELWCPESPRLYTRNISIAQGGSRDAVEVRFGFRTFGFREGLFYLNGAQRKLKGVNRHQDRAGKGWAVSPEDEAEDIRIIKEMGADALRTAHYPQTRHIYDLCDEQGIVCWVEYPNVNRLTLTDSFDRDMRRQVREMVAQHRNHPCIAMWGLFNELYNGEAWMRERSGEVEAMMARCRDDIHALDPSRTVVGVMGETGIKTLNAIPDEYGLNVYPQWYSDLSMREMLDWLFAESGRKTFAISEYGVGASVNQHGNPSVRPVSAGMWHPEEFQAYQMHDNYLQMLLEPRIWGTYVWAMFDFGADNRREGDRHGINDKGLVTHDRKTLKDAYYMYRASWTRTPTLHLVGSRMTSVTNGSVTVMGYSNVGPVTLLVNGCPVGTKDPDAAATVMWPDVSLRFGTNVIELVSGDRVARAQWVRELPAGVVPWNAASRAETLQWFCENVYGVRPVAAERPDVSFAKIGDDCVMMDGAALRKRVMISYCGPYGTNAFPVTAFIPTAAHRPVPAFLLICNRDPAINIDPSRINKTPFWPAEEIVKRGYAAIAFWSGDIAPDYDTGCTEGVFACFDKKAVSPKRLSWGTLSAWAWGASRVMDWIATEAALDAARVAVVGHSRGGKTALLAGVTDGRFAMACVNGSGCSGTKLNHLDLPDSEHLSDICRSFPYWFCKNYIQWVNRERDMPFDQHQLLALMAPRLVAVGSARDDRWAGPEGEAACCELARAAWTDRAAVHYHLRDGGHDLNQEDWQAYLDFADAHGWAR